jgi:hypothetical protein
VRIHVGRLQLRGHRGKALSEPPVPFLAISVEQGNRVLSDFRPADGLEILQASGPPESPQDAACSVSGLFLEEIIYSPSHPLQTFHPALRHRSCLAKSSHGVGSEVVESI